MMTDQTSFQFLVLQEPHPTNEKPLYAENRVLPDTLTPFQAKTWHFVD